MNKNCTSLASGNFLKLTIFWLSICQGPLLYSAPEFCKDLKLIEVNKISEGSKFNEVSKINEAISKFQNRFVELPITRQYVQLEHNIKSQELLFLTSAEYRKAVAYDEIPVNAILVIDEIPLGEDLPLVSAVIIGKELLLEATHIQVLAEKIGIPLIYSTGVFANSELKSLAKTSRSFELDCRNAQCKITGSQNRFIPQPKIQSVLPISFNRNVKKLYNYDIDRFTGRTQRELSGDKYFELMGFKLAFPHLVPDISSLSSGYFEEFLNTYSSSGQSLRAKYYQLNRDLEKAHSQNDESNVKQLLKTFREDILNSVHEKLGYDIFDEIVFELESYYYKIFQKKSNTSFSIRSNQDVEDLIAAGLYKSTIARALTKTELESNIRKSWASLYEYRAYNIRRYWGQRENNLSTPLMIHPFVGQGLGHSMGSFKINANSELELEVNLVLGEQEKATNPSAAAKVVQFSIFETKEGEPKLKLKSSTSDIKNQFESLSISDIEKPILDFFKEVRKFVKDEFNFRSYMPNKINIEFVVQRGEGFFGKPKVVVLQYKPSLNKEVVIDLLTGLLSREDTDKKSAKKNKLDDSDILMKNLSLKSLGQVLPGMYSQLAAQIKPPLYRYALLSKNKKPFLALWSTPVYHQSMRINLGNTDIKWLKSGYIKLTKGSPMIGPTLMFTETTDDLTDANLTVSMSQQLFQQALESALAESPELLQILLAEYPEVSFFTYEGHGKLQLPN
jgi:hypothetical protein